MRLLTALGREQPVVLVVDDVQWGDADSLALLAGVCALRFAVDAERRTLEEVAAAEADAGALRSFSLPE